MAKTNGGPAFPSAWHPTADGYARGDCGMSLRDYFAAQAIGGVLGNMQLLGGLEKMATLRGVGSSVLMAKMAYDIADEMLKAREE